MADERQSLYILMYKRTGCYYVGITETTKLDERMEKHFKANDKVECSRDNKANEGFYYYWYDIEVENGLALEESDVWTSWHSFAARVENEVTKWLANQVDKRFAVNGGSNANPKVKPLREAGSDKNNPYNKKTKKTIEERVEENKTYSSEDAERALVEKNFFTGIDTKLEVKFKLTLKDGFPREKKKKNI